MVIRIFGSDDIVKGFGSGLAWPVAMFVDVIDQIRQPELIAP
jgi:hypothetical protein